jgi:hypothetical protein
MLSSLAHVVIRAKRRIYSHCRFVVYRLNVTRDLHDKLKNGTAEKKCSGGG